MINIDQMSSTLRYNPRLMVNYIENLKFTCERKKQINK